MQELYSKDLPHLINAQLSEEIPSPLRRSSGILFFMIFLRGTRSLSKLNLSTYMSAFILLLKKNNTEGRGASVHGLLHAEQNNRQLARYAQFHCLDLYLWLANFKICLKMLSRWSHCNASMGEKYSDLLVVPKSLDAQGGKLVCLHLPLFLLRPASLRVSSSPWIIEVYIPGHFTYAPQWRGIWSISLHLHLFANQQIEEPNTYKSLVIHALHH